MFNCVPTIEVICMLVTIHLRLASQQCLVVALTTLPTIESHMVPYKYTRKAFQQFPCTLAGDSPKWNILVVTWALVICLKYTHSHSGCALVLVCIFQANHSCPCYNYYIPLWYAHLIGEGRQTCIHHITFVQRFANIDCGFKLWAQKRNDCGFHWL